MEDNNKPSVSWTKSAFELMSSLIMALLAVVMIFTLFLRLVNVQGESMMNTLQNGDSVVLVSRFYTIERGDIVVIYREGEAPLIKRVIALAGDEVAISPEGGAVQCNGKLLEEPYVLGGFTPTYGMNQACIVPEGCVFVMGDNRSDSLDSRQLGTFSLDQVVGKVVYRLWPLSSVE